MNFMIKIAMLRFAIVKWLIWQRCVMCFVLCGNGCERFA